MESTTPSRVVDSCEPREPCREERPARTVYRAVNHALLALIQAPPRRVLDLGCGDGSFARALRDRFPSAEVIGVTSSVEEKKEAEGRMSRVILADVTSSVIDTLGVFDTIICSHILEHIATPEELLSRLRCRLDGTLYAALPNTLHWRERLKLLRGRVPYADGGPFDRTHLRFFDVQSSAALLENAGLQIIHRANTGNAPLGFARALLPSLAERLDRSVTARFPGLFAEQFLFSATVPR